MGIDKLKALRGLRRSVTLIAVVMLSTLAACARPPSGQPLDTPTQVSALKPTSAATPARDNSNKWKPEPTPPLMDQVWQPPEPKKRVEISKMPQPTEIADSPDAMLVYEVASLGG